MVSQTNVADFVQEEGGMWMKYIRYSRNHPSMDVGSNGVAMDDKSDPFGRRCSLIAFALPHLHTPLALGSCSCKYNRDFRASPLQYAPLLRCFWPRRARSLQVTLPGGFGWRMTCVGKRGCSTGIHGRCDASCLPPPAEERAARCEISGGGSEVFFLQWWCARAASP